MSHDIAGLQAHICDMGIKPPLPLSKGVIKIKRESRWMGALDPLKHYLK